MKLDLSTFPNSLNRASRGSLKTLHKLLPNTSFSKNSQAGHESEEWFYSLRVIADTNLDENPERDWIITLIDESKIPTYRNYSTLISYNLADKKLIKAETFKPHRQ